MFSNKAKLTFPPLPHLYPPLFLDEQTDQYMGFMLASLIDDNFPLS